MPIQIVMPTLSPTMDKGKIAKWRVREGQQVKPGDVICEVETDKATIEVEAVDAGRVGKLLIPEGTADVKVNTPIAFLEGEATAMARGGLSQRVGLVRPLSAPRPTAGQPLAPPPETVPTARPGDVLPPSMPAGTVIGRARLKGDHGTSMPSSPMSSGVNPTVSLGGVSQAAGKTQYIRPEGLESDPVAGWVVIVEGLGRGGFRPIFVGMNSVGRDPSQRISLSFGDESISREEHAFITYDEEARSFYLQHGGKPNIIRLGGKPVLTPMELKANDMIKIGRTTLRFIPCCGPSFSWSDDMHDA
jgi:Biotin-requiring enzyme/FHA domain